ncbi:MAG: PAS domain-containing protein [Parvibaculum sp.]
MLSSGKEIFFGHDELIVSKTNLKGHLTYMNDVFLRVAGYSEAEVIGKPHNVIRHPDMPRAVFKLLWDKIQTGSEVFAYVVNTTKSLDYYWVVAHVTPSYGSDGKIVGYHSTRRLPNPSTVKNKIIPLYKELLAIEASNRNGKDGLSASFDHLLGILAKEELEYEEFIANLMKAA